MEQNTQKYFWRLLVLLTIFSNAVFVHLIPLLDHSQNITEISDTYHLYISPASYTYLAWELIYFAFIVYGIIQLTPSARNHSIYDSLAVPVIILNLLGLLWVYAYVNELPLISLSAGGLLLVVTFQSFSEARSAVSKKNYSVWLQFPFGFLSAALTYLILINLFEFLKHDGISEVNEGVPLSVTVIALTVLGLAIYIRTSSLIFPFVIAWFLLGVYAKHRSEAPGFSKMTMAAALVLVVFSLTLAVYRRMKFINKTRSKINAK